MCPQAACNTSSMSGLERDSPGCQAELSVWLQDPLTVDAVSAPEDPCLSIWVPPLLLLWVTDSIRCIPILPPSVAHVMGRTGVKRIQGQIYTVRLVDGPLKAVDACPCTSNLPSRAAITTHSTTHRATSINSNSRIATHIGRARTGAHSGSGSCQSGRWCPRC